MPDPADRIRVQTKRVRAPAPRWRRVVLTLVPTRGRSAAGAVLAALMVGILVNALALQHGRRIALAPDPSATASVRSPPPALPPAPAAAPARLVPPPAAPKPTAVADAAPAAPEPPVRPALVKPAPAKAALAKLAEAKTVEAKPAEAKTAEGRPADPIGDLLIKSSLPDRKRLVASAQGALVKLGYVVRPTGVPDADTRSALLAFAKSHHLPPSPEVTPKIVKALNAAIAED